MEDLIIGSHVSFTKDKQLLGSVIESLSYDANTFMFYTGAPQNTNRLPINEDLTKEGQKLMQESSIDINNVIIHAPYIINLANKKNQEFSVRFLKEEIDRAISLGIKKIVLHPGSHVGAGVEEGLNNIIESLNLTLTKDMDILICLETMAGKGSELGSDFYQIKTIIDNVKLNEKLMVCLDTCHLNDSGYDVNNFDEVLNSFDEIIGLEKIGCIHINDSKNILNSHKDRHENLGFGSLSFDTILKIIYHEKLKNIPKILETPYVSMSDNSKDRMYPPYKFEIEMIRNKKFNPNLIKEIREFYR